MKKIFKQVILPLLVFGIAIAGVFATNSSTMGVEQPSQPLYMGSFLYKDASGNCHKITPNPDPVTRNCTLINSGVKCTLLSFELFDGENIPGTDEWICTVPLYKRTIP